MTVIEFSEPGTELTLTFRARGAARLMAADDGPRIAALAFDRWDTHANERALTSGISE